MPVCSLNINFPNKIIVKRGDHNIVTSDKRKQWIETTIKFIRKNL